MNWLVYSHDDISINIDTNSNILFNNFGNKAKDASYNINEFTGNDSIIYIIFETKNKSIEEIREILIQNMNK